MEAFVTQLNIKVILVSPKNRKSLQAKHSIKSLSGLLVKHLSEVWSWHSCLPIACYDIMPIPPPILMATVHMSWYLDIK